MAIQIKHTCSEQKDDYISVEADLGKGVVHLYGEECGDAFDFFFDVSTAIKLSKTIRTEINKVKSQDNG